ncbi:helix-turn-helix domain-containing protein, partial [Microbacterium sp. CH12i]|uniref:helix-turn-helix domain-containing protein n=1 Tax=Microbacterium sp. CH12i TaxID=1479651 RepID=UPI00126960CB
MRLIGFEWRLREVMAAAGMFSTTKLVPLLEERGVYLSTSQVYRLAAEKPERMNMQALVALLDIFDCTFEELAPACPRRRSRGDRHGRRRAGEGRLGDETAP